MSETTVTSKAASTQTARPFSLSQHSLTGAMIAAFIAALWAVQYLTGTVASIDLFLIVTGELSSGLNEAGAEPLFVVVTRFIVGFGLSWGPITAILAAVRRG